MKKYLVFLLVLSLFFALPIAAEEVACLHESPVAPIYLPYTAYEHSVYMICPDCYARTAEATQPHGFGADGICTLCGLQGTPGTVEDEPKEEVPPADEPAPGEENPAVEEKGESTGETTYIISQFFEEKILPLIISAGSAFVMFIGAIVPAIKNAGKFKRLQGIYAATKAENEKFAELLKSTDIAKFKETIENLLTGDLKKKIAELGNFQPQFDEIYAKLELLFAQMQAMKEGALNAWAQSPAAVAALTSSPTESAVLKLVQHNKALEGYIKEQKGEEAEKIIAELKGETADDEQGNVPTV